MFFKLVNGRGGQSFLNAPKSEEGGFLQIYIIYVKCRFREKLVGGRLPPPPTKNAHLLNLKNCRLLASRYFIYMLNIFNYQTAWNPTVINVPVRIRCANEKKNLSVRVRFL